MATQTCAEWVWQQHHFRAMNTGIAVYWCGDGADTAEELESLFAIYEQSLSRFGNTAELVRLNRSGETVCPVSERLYAALEAALWAARATNGLYDPTLLDALEQAGYDRSFETMTTRGPFQWTTTMDAPMDRIASSGLGRAWDWRHVELLHELPAVRRPPGLRLDLGGIGKGWTVDRTADLLHGQGPYLINAGGDLYAAGRPDGVHGWTLEIEHPLQAEAWVARVQVCDAALATSTITKRRWRQGDTMQHHLIDPRSGRPAQTDALSVSVVARRTAIAEVMAKAALILGAEAGLAYLQATPEIEGLVYRSDGQVLYTAGFEPYVLEVDPHGRRSIAA